MVRQKFEQEWMNAFEGAELEPSEMVWTNIELGLEKDSGGKMKRRLLFFQLLAAASMVFAMGIGGVYFLEGSKSNFFQNNSLAQEEITKSTLPETAQQLRDNRAEDSKEISETNSELTPSNNLSTGSSENTSVSSEKSKGYNASRASSNFGISKNKLTNDNNIDKSRSIKGITNQNSDHKWKGGAFNPYTNRKSGNLISYNNPSLNFKKSERDPGEELLARLEAEERMLNKKEEKKSLTNEKIWTSVGFGAGTFNPNTSGSTTVNSMGLAASGTPSSSNPTTGSSYSVGVSVGTKVSRRFLIQGGISYLTQNSEYTSSAAAGDKVTLNEFSTSDAKTIASSPYKVNSNIQFVSIPLQAGYLVLDRAFAIQLNGGLSTDLFLLGTLTSEDSKLEKVSQGPGSDSPYRSVNFSGLVGSEFSYRFSDRYRVALNPGLRYALNSIYKSEVPADVSPVTFDVSVKFRYILH